VHKCAEQVRILGREWIRHGIIFVSAFDDTIAQKALRDNGFEDVAASLRHMFDDHQNTARRRSERPKVHEADTPSGA
jgi:hypothetical protein